MPRVLVSGLVNLETTVRVPGFPLPYFPVTYPFHGVATTVSGVGVNVAKALHTLGHTVDLATLVGRDALGALAVADLAGAGLATGGIAADLDATPASVVLLAPDGRRQIHVDLKDIQERPYAPPDLDARLAAADLAVLCNINFSRPLLARARAAGVPIATDVHVLSEVDDPYNGDFIRAADLLFASDEHVRDRPEAFLRDLAAATSARYVVLGRGADGALLYDREDGRLHALPAVEARPIASTIGAGDALFSAFVDGILRGLAGPPALARAIRFAAWKIGARSAAEGFLTADALDALAPAP